MKKLFTVLFTVFAFTCLAQNEALKSAFDLYYKGLTVPAKNAVDAYLRTNFNDGEAFQLKGRIEFDAGHWAESEGWFEQAAATTNQYPKVAWLFLAKARSYQGKFQKALSAYYKLGEKSDLKTKVLVEIYMNELACDRDAESDRTAGYILIGDDDRARSLIKGIIRMDDRREFAKKIINDWMTDTAGKSTK